MPFLNKLFGNSVNTLETALNLRIEKQGLIQSNIANIETPGYKRQGMSFEDAMAGSMAGSGRLAVTNSKHIALDSFGSPTNSSITTENRPVDLDEEMLELSENQLMYQITAKVIAKRFAALNTVIDEGGK